jgi:hypothetical protein
MWWEGRLRRPVLLRHRITPATMGDASVPSLPPSHPRPYETNALPNSFHTNLPVKARRGFACLFSCLDSFVHLHDRPCLPSMEFQQAYSGSQPPRRGA